MMPLTLADLDEETVIKRIGGDPETKKHLEDMGFVTGGTVKLVSRVGENLIVSVKGSRVAISSVMARKIMA